VSDVITQLFAADFVILLVLIIWGATKQSA